MIPQPIEAKIIDRGRGPEIYGTRITVFNIMDFMDDWHISQIACHFRISTRQVQAAIDYINAHKEELMPQYQEMVEEGERGNPPELREKLEASRAKFLEFVRQVHEKNGQGGGDAGNLGGR